MKEIDIIPLLHKRLVKLTNYESMISKKVDFMATEFIWNVIVNSSFLSGKNYDYD